MTISGDFIGSNRSWGVFISDFTDVTLTDNLIGLDISGTSERGNGDDGVYVHGASDVTIGGASAADRNWISGNDRYGVFTDSPTCAGIGSISRAIAMLGSSTSLPPWPVRLRSANGMTGSGGHVPALDDRSDPVC